MSKFQAVCDSDIVAIERLLGSVLPRSYREFVSERGADVIGGHYIVGIKPIGDHPSVVDLTVSLYEARTDIPKTYLAISFKEKQYLCIDTLSGDDPNLIEVSIHENARAQWLPITFSQYIIYLEERSVSYRIAFERMRNRKKDFENRFGNKQRHLRRTSWDDSEHSVKRTYESGISRKSRKTRIETLKADSGDWHPRLFRLHDMVVGMFCFRRNINFGCVEVDVFWAPDDARVDKDQIVKGVLAALLADALKVAGTPRLTFTRDPRERENGVIQSENRVEKEGKDFKRQRTMVPIDITKFSERAGVTLKNSDNGEISAEESNALWWAALGISNAAFSAVNKLERDGWISRESFAYILTQGYWERSEAEWILQNAPRPEGVLFGTDMPENRLAYSESLAYGRAALIVSRFVRRIVLDLTQGVSTEDIPAPRYSVDTNGPFQILSIDTAYWMPWLAYNKETFLVPANKPVLVLPRPRCPFSRDVETEWLRHQIRHCATYEGEYAYRCVIVSMELEYKEWIEDIIHEASDHGILLLFCQQRLDLYEDDVAERMRKARVQRRFPGRLLPIKLEAYSVAGEIWKDHSSGLGMLARTAMTFARWIAKHVEIQRARSELSVHTRALENEVARDVCSMHVCTLSSDESIAVQKTLTRNEPAYVGIRLSFVDPSWMKQFLSSLPRRVRRKLRINKDAGLVFVHPAFEQIDLDATMNQVKLEKRVHVTPVPEECPLPEFDSNRFAISYKKREIKRYELGITEALRKGHPLNVSYLSMSLFADAVLQNLWHTEARIPHTKGWRSILRIMGVSRNRPATDADDDTSVGLRIQYNDGTEGEPFPLFSLPPINQPKRLKQVNLGTLSMRHSTTDFAVAAYLMINLEVQMRRGSGSSEQEAFAYYRTYHFVQNLLQAAKGNIRDEIASKDPVYSVLLREHAIGSPPTSGLEIHLFQSTGLQPVTIGAYRALRDLIAENRGRLVVVPRILDPKRTIRSNGKTDMSDNDIVEQSFATAQPWY